MKFIARFGNSLITSLLIIEFGFSNSAKAADVNPLRPVDASSPRATFQIGVTVPIYYIRSVGAPHERSGEMAFGLLPGISGLTLYERRRRPILVMEAYIDDSGKGNPPVFLLAGFLSRAEQWEDFSEKWVDALRGSPKLDYFKMSEAAAFEGQFRGWNEEDRDARLAELVGIIKDHVLLGVSSVVYHRDYDEIIKDKLSKETDNPYWFMYHAIMETTYRWDIENGIKEKVNFIFDEQFKQSDIVQGAWSIYYEQAPTHFKELFGERPVHKNDVGTWPLQAADMLAWHIRRSYYELELGNVFTSPTMEVLRSIKGAHDPWTRDRLQEIVFGVDKLNVDLGRVTPHQYRDMKIRLPDNISRMNLNHIGNMPSNACGLVVPYPAIGTRRFLLVDSCPFSRNPHLHRRSGNKCILQEQASDSIAGSGTQQ
jgi:hypothetical protein